MKKHKTFKTALEPLKAILVGVDFSAASQGSPTNGLQELEQLAYTCHITVIAQFTQRLEKPHTKMFIGSGKVEEIQHFLQGNKVDLVIFDDDLKPNQLKNLENIWRHKVWDRSFLILQIFAMHARTAEAKIQVELAQYQYMLPRLTGMWTHLSRQQGGIGGRGPGEKELETDKRIAQNKIRILKSKLVHINQVAQTKRKQRKQYPNVALIGYTNVGKSTLMQCLSKEMVWADDQLFATLAPTVRRVVVKDIHYLLSDTVGFIHKLPTTLIASFKSTLAEVCEADLLLHVVDASNPAHTKHITVVHKILQEIHAEDIPMLLVLNKVDAIEAPSIAALQAQYKAQYDLPVTYCSALKKQHIEQLQTSIYQILSQQRPRSSMDRTKVS